jgi:LacI family transcriptional regulator, repressor for deo operon, udp, cdd, tsx, nupC, and nupG
MIAQTPWVQCAEYADAGDISCVGISDTDASEHAVRHLLKRGCRRIALINHDLSYKYAQLRERGYKTVMGQQDVGYEAIEYASDLSFRSGKAAMVKLLEADPRPDGVFAVSDTLAAGAMRAIEAAGLSIPRDIAVVGFDGSELAEMVSPQLTTIEQPSRQIGRQAVVLLLKKIDNPDAPAERVIMDWHFIARASA